MATKINVIDRNDKLNVQDFHDFEQDWLKLKQYLEKMGC